jgi:high-affinity iron transporter
MFGTGLIVFRETVEAALFVGIVAASTRGVIHRTRWLSFGVAAGAMGSVLMASAMDRISSWADGIGQDIVTLCILSIALCMLAWHCILVSPNSNQMVQDAKQIGTSTSQGDKTLWALAVAVALSVLREGAETVLFVSGLITGSSESQGTIILSVAIGLTMGAFTGWLIYEGLGKVKPQRLFAVTNILILMLAGSLASQLAKTASQADWISLFGEQAWDISVLLPNDSAIGMVLHGVIGFDASPTQLQVLFYLSTTSLIWIAARQMKLLISQRQNALSAKI